MKTELKGASGKLRHTTPQIQAPENKADLIIFVCMVMGSLFIGAVATLAMGL